MTLVFKLIGQFVQVIFFFLKLYREKDKEKSAKKKRVADEITAAFTETDKKLRVSRLNVAVANINKL